MARVGRSLAAADWSRLRLADRIERGVRVLLVGINPGVRSALTGHHFAGPSNRFWKLLFESRLVPRALTFEEDGLLPQFGFGITNLVARPSPGIDDLKPAEYLAGWKILEEKIRTYRPEVVALVGVTLYRAIRPLVEGSTGEPLQQVATDSCRIPARRHSRCTHLRAAQSQRPQCKFLVRRDAGGFQSIEAGASCVATSRGPGTIGVHRGSAPMRVHTVCHPWHPRVSPLASG